jgi:uncharacterized protein YndB with AHSA1/START domain
MKNAIEMQLELKAPIAKVWRAVTDHEQFGSWFQVRLDGPFIVGEMSTGQVTYEGYTHLKWVARVEKMDNERRFVYAWWPLDDDARADGSSPHETEVEFLFESTEDGTRLTITESGFNALPEDSNREEVFRRNSGGWDQQTVNIRAYVES